MLLRVGTALMIFAVALAAVVAVVVNLSGAEEPAPTVASAEPQAAETPVRENKPETGKKKIEDEPRSEPRTKSSEEPLANPREEAQAKSSEEPREERKAETLPVSSEDWQRPSEEEIANASGPRYYSPRGDAELTLTIEALGVYDAPVIDSTSEEALNNGVVHIPETPMPWDERQQKNVYLAGHRIGYDGTGSRMVFYNLDKLSDGDSIVLEDRSGNVYKYRVSEMFVVEPDAGWVLDPVRDRDMLTLQTCTYPTFENRLIVRADRT
ncbi:hypothetical protein BH24ACT19_BH24ACT19_09100 [soil metagenome]|jgi:sortase A